MELFEKADNSGNEPLAYRMRPRNLDEYIGQDHIVGPGRLLRRAIQADRLSSVIFYGPPGTGKTTLARVIAGTTQSHFSTLNAVLSGVKELREEIDAAKNRLALYGKRTILFVDEVHRWNKSQQDALLPWVENGTCILIGATTENPFFEVNAALVSRSRIFQLKPLTEDDLFRIAEQALKDPVRGYGKYEVTFENGALEHLVQVSSGDARSLLNALELAVVTSEKTLSEDGKTRVYISKEAAEESIQQKAVLYDKEGDYHFDVISAFIKSLRGSDPDAALYWLAKMVYAGEDPRFIFRRMLILACEDVGMANPAAISVVEADAAAFDRIGMPEGRYHLTHACLYLSTAPKSNSAMGFFDALKMVSEEEKFAEVPNHLRDANRDSKGFNHGEGYMYPHAYRDHWVGQQYLPSSLQGKVFYHPSEIGYEKTIKAEVLRKREIQLETVNVNAFPENLTYSPENKGKEEWIIRTERTASAALQSIREKIFEKTDIKRSDRVLTINSGNGLLTWEALRRVPEGGVISHVQSKTEENFINHYAEMLDDMDKPRVITNLKELKKTDPALRVEWVLARNAVFFNNDLSEIRDFMTPDGVIASAESILSLGSKLSDFVAPGEVRSLMGAAEKEIYSGGYDEILNAYKAVFKITDTEKFSFTEERIPSKADIERWITRSYVPVLRALRGADFSDEKSENFVKDAVGALAGRSLSWKSVQLIIRGGA